MWVMSADGRLLEYVELEFDLLTLSEGNLLKW